MFDIGFWEILLILILALVVIGPERLPGAARQAGLFVGKARRYIEGVRSEVESELDVGEFKRMLHNQEVQINELQQQLKAGVDEVKADLPGNDVLADLHELKDGIIHEPSDSDVDDKVVNKVANRAVSTGTDDAIAPDAAASSAENEKV